MELNDEEKEYVEEYITNVCNKYNLSNFIWVVYVLRSETQPDLMYVGSTNNIRRRLRQHNKIIKGGGKYTNNRNAWLWRLAALITGIENQSEALKVEYWTKAKNYKNQSKIPTHCPVKRRLYLIQKTMEKHDITDVIYIDREFRKLARNL